MVIFGRTGYYSRMFRARFHSVGRPAHRFPARFLPATLAVFCLAACIPPRVTEPTALDRGQAAVSQTFANMADNIDLLFGAPRLEDKQRKVKVLVSSRTNFREDGAVWNRTRVSARLPLPSLERKANFFLNLGGDTSSLSDSAVPSSITDPFRNYDASLEYLSLKRANLSPGLSLSLGWRDGNPATVIKPLIRWELDRVPWRFYATEEVWWSSEEKWGERTYGQVDYIVNEHGYVRLLSEAVKRQDVDGFDLQHALLFRQPLWENAALSWEIGTLYNPLFMDLGRNYAQINAITKVWRPWLEFEVRPRMVMWWDQNGRVDYSIRFGVNVIFEEFLHRDD
jgi:hypothetical protein